VQRVTIHTFNDKRVLGLGLDRTGSNCGACVRSCIRLSYFLTLLLGERLAFGGGTVVALAFVHES